MAIAASENKQFETSPGIIFDDPEKPARITDEYWAPLRKRREERLKKISQTSEVNNERQEQPAKNEEPLKVSAELVGQTIVCILVDGTSHEGTLSHLLDPSTGRTLSSAHSAGSFAIALSNAIPPIQDGPPIIQHGAILSIAPAPVCN